VDRDIIHPLVLKWREEEAKKKNGGGGSAAGGAVAALLLACLLFSSCAYVKQGVSLLDDYLQSTQTSTNSPALSPASTNMPALPPPTPPQPPRTSSDLSCHEPTANRPGGNGLTIALQ
ncbi:MAG: hypothetical protein WCN95_16895, partial [bacterium]